MPKFLEAKLKREYGANSAVPYKIMNAMGVMHGNKVTAKGRAMERKHESAKESVEKAMKKSREHGGKAYTKR